MSLAEIYRKFWEDKFGLGKGWSANWWPGTSISLGERGVMRDGRLQHQGYVGDYGVSFDLDPVHSPVSGSWDYSSSGDTKVEIGADASVPGWEWLGHASAGLSVTFGNQESIYISAGGTTIERVADNDRLQMDLLNTAFEHGMPIGQCVVVERQLTTQAMVIVSSGKSGELKAALSGDVKVSSVAQGAVASLAGHLDIKRQTGGTSKQEYPTGMVLAYRIITLGTRGWWFWRHLTVRGITGVDDSLIETALEPDDYFIMFQ